jgi:hypothetical protein
MALPAAQDASIVTAEAEQLKRLAQREQTWRYAFTRSSLVIAEGVV